MGVNWAIFAIEKLKEYESKKTAIDNLTEQIELLEAKFTAIKSAATDSTPIKGGETNKREEMLINNITTREELINNREIIKHEIAMTEKGLAALSETELKILDYFYINRPKGYIERLCDELYISKTELYRQKDNALKHFTMVCYGIIEL